MGGGLLQADIYVLVKCPHYFSHSSLAGYKMSQAHPAPSLPPSRKWPFLQEPLTAFSTEWHSEKENRALSLFMVQRERGRLLPGPVSGQRRETHAPAIHSLTHMYTFTHFYVYLLIFKTRAGFAIAGCSPVPQAHSSLLTFRICDAPSNS